MVFFSVFLSYALPPSCVPWLHSRYPLPSYYGRSDSRQPGSRTICPTHPAALAGLPDYCRMTSSHSVSNHLRVDRGSPGCQRVFPAVTGFVLPYQTRPLTPTESSSRRQPFWAACVTDWSFSFRCSPPRLAATQLRFDTPRLFTAGKRTLTVLSPRLLRRTSAVTCHRFSQATCRRRRW